MEFKKHSTFIYQIQKHASILSAIFSFIGIIIYGTSYVQGRIMELESKIAQVSNAQINDSGDILDIKKNLADSIAKHETSLSSLEQQIDDDLFHLQEKIDRIYVLMASKKE